MSICLGVSALILMKQHTKEAFLGIVQATMIMWLIAILILKGRERVPKRGDRRVLKRRRDDRLNIEDNQKAV